MTNQDKKRFFQKNLELTRSIYGAPRRWLAYLLTRCDCEAVEKGAITENGQVIEPKKTALLS